MKNYNRGIAHALRGIKDFYLTETNAFVHTAFAVGVIVSAYFCNVSIVEWLFILLAITLVFSAEIMNTCIEKIADLITLNHHPTIRMIKDMAAGAVLVCAIFAFITGVIIFGNKLLLLL